MLGSCTRCHLREVTPSEVSFPFMHQFMNLTSGSEVPDRQFMDTWTNFWTQNLGEQHGKPVHLPEGLWQYHVHCGPKRQVLGNRSHRDEYKWSWYTKWQQFCSFLEQWGILWVRMGSKLKIGDFVVMINLEIQNKRFHLPATAGLAIDCRVGLRWHFCCGYLILKPRPVLAHQKT